MTNKMKREKTASHIESSLLDDFAETRELEAFFSQQDPVDIATVDWHTRQEQGLTPAEQQDFQHWLAEDSAHSASYSRLERNMTTLKSVIVERAEPSTKKKSRRLIGIQSIWHGLSVRRTGWAFCCVTLLAVGIAWFQWYEPADFSTQYVSERGQRQNIVLPDGSQLSMDVETQAKVMLYADRREVRIQEGQVMFDVAPDADKPFHVFVGKTRITVVGTQFSVRYRQSGIDAKNINVSVEEGHVRVIDTRSQTNREMDLTAGQQLLVSSEGEIGQIADIMPNSVALWRKGLISFDNTQLADAILEMERYGDTRLFIRDPLVAKMAIGGSFQINQPEGFAQMLTQILPVKLVKRGNGKTEIVRLPS